MLVISHAAVRLLVIGTLLLVIEALSASPTQAQIQKGTLRFGGLKPCEVQNLLDSLKQDPRGLAAVQEYFFDVIQDSLYDPNLADIVVFSSSDSRGTGKRHAHTIELTNTGWMNPHLWGKRKVYLLLFYEHHLPPPDAKSEDSIAQKKKEVASCDQDYMKCLKDIRQRLDTLNGLAATDSALLYTRLQTQCFWQWEKCVSESSVAPIERWSPDKAELHLPLADSGSLKVDLDFVEPKEPGSDEKQPPNKVLVRLSPLDYRPGHGQSLVTSAVRTVGSFFGMGAIKTPPSDTSLMATDTIQLHKLGADTSGQKELYFGIGRLPIRENSVNRVSVEMPDSLTVAQATFGNYDASRFGVSIAVGMTGVRGATDILGVQSAKVHTEVFVDTVVTLNGSGTIDTTIKEITRDSITSSIITEDDYPLDVYIIGHYHFMRPQLPYYRVKGHNLPSRLTPLTWGIFAGTRLSKDDFLDDFVFGISGSGMVFKQQQIGFLLGANFWRHRPSIDSEHRERKLRLFLGLYYRL
jgi:hypothetical protein